MSTRNRSGDKLSQIIDDMTFESSILALHAAIAAAEAGEPPSRAGQVAAPVLRSAPRGKREDTA